MLRQFGNILAGVVAVCGTIVLALAGLTLARGAGEPVAVVAVGGPEAALAAIAAAGGDVLEVRGAQVIAISSSSAFVPRLYRAGALLVALAGQGGCGFGASRSSPPRASLPDRGSASPAPRAAAPPLPPA
jgi:hypothetical protein